MRIFLSLLLAGIVISTIGCGGHTMMDPCTVVGLNVGPASATVNHTAAPPANGQIFGVTSRFSGVCPAATAIPPTANWTVSDPSIHFSATQGSSVTATCTAALASPATVTATLVGNNMVTGTATLTCN